MKRYRAVIYDIDGTVLNTLNMNMYPLMKIIKEEIGEDWSFEEVLKFAAYPGMKVMEELNIKDKEETYNRWVRYVNEYQEGASLYEGFEEVFEKFRSANMVQAVVSAKTRKQYEIDVVSKGIDRYMSAVILADDTKLHKPYPEPLLECVKRLDMAVDEVIYIGDAKSDYEAARNAHMDFGYAKWGSVSENGIDLPEYVFDQPLDLLKLI
jgi:HAD superfamily hydrolase (TIGR01549 family)